MNKLLHDIDRLFYEGLAGGEEQPSARVWTSVEVRLEKERAEAAGKKAKRLKRLSALLLLLLLGLSGYLIQSLQRNETAQTKQAASAGPVLDESTQKHTATDLLRQSQAAAFVPDEEQASDKSKRLASSETVPDRQTSQLQNEAHKTDLLSERMVEDFPLPAHDDNAAFFEREEISFVASTKKTTLAYAALRINRQPLFAESQPPESKRKKREANFSIAAFYSPNLASYRLKAESAATADRVQQIEKAEKHDASFTAGLLMDYRLNKNWALQSGLQFSHTDIIVGPNTVYAQPDNEGNIKYKLNLSSGYGYFAPGFRPQPSIGDSLQVTAVAHKLNYLLLPLSLKHRFVHGKFSLDVGGGVALQLLTSAKVETEVQHGTANETDVLDKLQGLKPASFSGHAFLEAGYRLTKTLSVQLRPAANLALTPINKEGLVKTYPRSFGLGFGLKKDL